MNETCMNGIMDGMSGRRTAATVRTSCGTDQLFGVKSSCWGVIVALDTLDKLTATATLPTGACTCIRESVRLRNQ